MIHCIFFITVSLQNYDYFSFNFIAKTSSLVSSLRSINIITLNYAKHPLTKYSISGNIDYIDYIDLLNS